MNAYTHPIALALIAATLPACARGCSSSATPTPPDSAAAQAPARADVASKATHPADSIEKALGITLPERKPTATGEGAVEVLPGLALMPFRRVRDLRPDQTLLLRVAPDGVRVLERRMTADQIADETQLVELLKWARDQWQARSGTPASRLVLAPDAQVAPVLLRSVRRAAQVAHGWRVTLLARDGAELVEVVTTMPGERAVLPQAATPTTR